MISLAAYPACERYLRSMRVDMTQKGMNAYYAALTVADNFDDEELTEAGTVNFWTMDGDQCLAGVEQFLKQRREAKPSRVPIEDLRRLAAFLGANGVKTSSLKGDDAYWAAAFKLWPEHIERTENATLSGLLHQIASIPKKQRRSIARQNRKVN